MPQLGLAMDSCKCESWRLFALHMPDAELRDGPDVVWVKPRVPAIPFNGIWQARLDAEKTDSQIDEVLLQAKAPLHWWVGPSSSPAALAERLEARGLSRADLPAMAADLRRSQSETPAPPGLEIRRVQTPEMLDSYFQAWIEGFGSSREFAEHFRGVYLGIGLSEDAPVQHFVGLMHGAPVASASLFMSKQVAEVYSVSTIPRARRQGVATAMTLAAMRRARDEGYLIACLYASEAGYNVYRGLGFQQFYEVSTFRWMG